MAAIASYASTPTITPAPFAQNRKVLLAALTLLGKFTDRRSSLAVLADLRLDFNDGRQRIQATDLNNSVSYYAPPGETGAAVHGVTVNAKLLTDMVKSASGAEVILSKSGTGITVASNGADMSLLGTGQEFPKVPELLGDMASYDTVDAAILRTGIERCIHAVCRDETRFHLNGVYLGGNGNQHTLVSTDGHRLIKVCETVPNGRALNGKGILPTAACKLLCEIAKRCNAMRTKVNGTMLHVLALCGDGARWEASFKMIDAQFPPYEQVIPTDYRNLCTVERKPLIAALKRAKALCTATRGALLTVASGKLTITSDHPDSGTIAESLTAEVSPDAAVKFGLNAGYLLDAIEGIECPHVTLSFGEPNPLDAKHNPGEYLTPVIVRGTDDQVEHSVTNARQIEVIMPMRI